MEEDIYQCSVCKMKHRMDGFSINRLGIRKKSCNSCRARSQKQRDDKKIQHEKEVANLKEEELKKIYDDNKDYFVKLMKDAEDRENTQEI